MVHELASIITAVIVTNVWIPDNQLWTDENDSDNSETATLIWQNKTINILVSNLPRMVECGFGQNSASELQRKQNYVTERERKMARTRWPRQQRVWPYTIQCKRSTLLISTQSMAFSQTDFASLCSHTYHVSFQGHPSSEVFCGKCTNLSGRILFRSIISSRRDKLYFAIFSHEKRKHVSNKNSRPWICLYTAFMKFLTVTNHIPGVE